MPVPAGATTGNVVVTVSGAGEQWLPFTVDVRAEHDDALADERAGRDVGHDHRNQFRSDERHEHRHVQRNDGDADDLVGDEHRRAGAGGRDDGQRAS